MHDSKAFQRGLEGPIKLPPVNDWAKFYKATIRKKGNTARGVGAAILARAMQLCIVRLLDPQLNPVDEFRSAEEYHSGICQALPAGATRGLPEFQKAMADHLANNDSPAFLKKAWEAFLNGRP